MDFTNDVNYLGFFHLQNAIKQGKPEGLKVFGKWNTVYEALAEMPSKEVLLAQLLGVLQGPSRGLVTVIQAVPRQLVTVSPAFPILKGTASTLVGMIVYRASA